MGDQTARLALSGRRIALLETREAERLAAMLGKAGAEVLSCPLVGIADPGDPTAALAWLNRCVTTPCDDLILLTGEGLDRLLGLARRAGIETAFIAALGKARIVTRGPKPARALRRIGLKPGLRAEEPTTEGVVALLSKEDLGGRRVGVQIYPGGAGGRLLDFLRAARAMPDPVTPYEYAPQAVEQSVAALIARMAAGEVDVVVFTSAGQVRRLFDVARARAEEKRLDLALQRTAVAAVGPVVAGELRRRGVTVAIQPETAYFIKPLVSSIVAALG
ncbi:MAG: uroporphyrinogen-III synthase [Stellaceae bacterium]